MQLPFIQFDAYIFFDTMNLGCVDDPNGFQGYNCSEYEKYCSDSYKDVNFEYDANYDWYRRFRAACKSTCSRYASSYCTEVTCKG